MSLPNCATRAEPGVFFSIVESMKIAIRWTGLPCSNFASLSGSMPGGKPLFWFFNAPTAVAIGSTPATAGGDPDLMASPSVDWLMRCGWITSTPHEVGRKILRQAGRTRRIGSPATPDGAAQLPGPRATNVE